MHNIITLLDIHRKDCYLVINTWVSLLPCYQYMDEIHCYKYMEIIAHL